MFPQISIVSPLYMLLRTLHLIDTYPGLMLPYLTFAMPLAVWLLVGFFRQLPARPRGSGDRRRRDPMAELQRVILPLTRPGARDHGDSHIHLLLERVPVRALVHARPGAADSAGGDRALPRPVPGAVGPDPRGAVVATAPVRRGLAFQRRIVQGLTAGAVKG